MDARQVGQVCEFVFSRAPERGARSRGPGCGSGWRRVDPGAVLRGRLLVALVGAVVATLALLALPGRAMAAILPACEDAPLATMIPPPPEPTCEVVTTVDEETGTTKAAPICDPRGASAVAPPSILPVVDARLVAVKSCNGGEGLVGVAPGRTDHGGSIGWVPPQAALPDGDALVPAAMYMDAPALPPCGGEPRAGVRSEVYHPPR
jgi:hypothetical protein